MKSSHWSRGWLSSPQVLYCALLAASQSTWSLSWIIIVTTIISTFTRLRSDSARLGPDYLFRAASVLCFGGDLRNIGENDSFVIRGQDPICQPRVLFHLISPMQHVWTSWSALAVGMFLAESLVGLAIEHVKSNGWLVPGCFATSNT